MRVRGHVAGSVPVDPGPDGFAQLIIGALRGRQSRASAQTLVTWPQAVITTPDRRGRVAVRVIAMPNNA